MTVRPLEPTGSKAVTPESRIPRLQSWEYVKLDIDGKKYKFGHDYFTKEEESDKPNFDSFWSSGGLVTCDDEWNFDVLSGEWEIDVERIPEQFRDLAAEINEVFNENVPYGCCGGCI